MDDRTASSSQRCPGPQPSAPRSRRRPRSRPQEEVLKKNGLKTRGPIYVLETESDVKKKVSEVKLLSKQWNHARLQQQSVVSVKDHQALIQGLAGQVNQLRAEINVVNQQMNRLPRYRGRLANNYAQEEYAELFANRNQLNFTLTQQSALLGQVKSQPPDPKLKQKIDDEIQARHDEYVQAVHDLSQLVATTKDKYARRPRTRRSRRLSPVSIRRSNPGPSSARRTNSTRPSSLRNDSRRTPHSLPLSPRPRRPPSRDAVRIRYGPHRDDAAAGGTPLPHLRTLPPTPPPATPFGARFAHTTASRGQGRFPVFATCRMWRTAMTCSFKSAMADDGRQRSPARPRARVRCWRQHLFWRWAVARRVRW